MSLLKVNNLVTGLRNGAAIVELNRVCPHFTLRACAEMTAGFIP
ncbi:hypothetical protein [Ferrigenium sp. UT5]